MSELVAMTMESKLDRALGLDAKALLSMALKSNLRLRGDPDTLRRLRRRLNHLRAANRAAFGPLIFKLKGASLQIINSTKPLTDIEELFL